MRLKLIAAALLTVAAFTPAEAACSSLASSFVARMNSIVAGSGNCQKVIDGGAAYRDQVCKVCNGTRVKLIALRNTFNANEECLKNDKNVKARINDLWDLRGKVNKLEKQCGG